MDWSSPSDVFRVTVLTISFICLLELVRFLFTYWKVIYPIRLQIGDTVIAPPAKVTLMYHCLVGGLIACNMYGVIFNLTRDRPINPALFPLVVITVCLTYVINLFNKTYTKLLMEGPDAPRY